MADLNRRLLVGLACAASLIFGAGAAAPEGPNLADQMTLGNPKAKVEMIEYASASCPHCGRFALDVFPAFKKKYIDTGKVHFTFREVLTPPTELAAAGFLLARCGPRDKYFSTLDSVFASQKTWVEGVDLKATFLKIGQSEGITEAQFNACMSDQAAFKALNDRVTKYPTQDKVEATPTFLINGQRLEGEQTLADLDKAVAAAAAAAPASHKPTARH